MMPKQPKSPLGKPGFGLTCRFYEILLHTELQMFQVFRRLTLKSRFTGLQEQDKIFSTWWDWLLWCKERLGTCFTAAQGRDVMDAQLAGSWGQLKRQRGRKRDGKAGEESSGSAEFWLPLLAERWPLVPGTGWSTASPHLGLSAQLLSITTSILRHLNFSPLASFSPLSGRVSPLNQQPNNLPNGP